MSRSSRHWSLGICFLSILLLLPAATTSEPPANKENHFAQRAKAQAVQNLLLKGPFSSGARKGFGLASADQKHVLYPAQTVVSNVAYLRQLGVDVVRYPIYLSIEPSLNVWLNLLSQIHAYTSANGITLVIDLHHCESNPGASSPRDRDSFYRIWERIARFFSGKARLCYELLNEPGRRDWHEIACEAATRIRRNDATTTIIYGPRNSVNPNLMFQDSINLLTYTVNGRPGTRKIENQILTVHLWLWSALGDVQDYRQRDIFYPSLAPRRTKADIVDVLERLRRLQQQLGTEIYIGEVGILRNNRDTAMFLNDVLDRVDRFGFHCSVHCFREADFWDYEQDSAAWTVISDWLRR